MRPRHAFLLLALAAGLALAVSLVLARTGREPAQEFAPSSASADGEPAPADALETEPSAVDETPELRQRAALALGDEGVASVDPNRRRDARRHEAELLAQFMKLREEQGNATLERSVREVLASPTETLPRKNAGLRALHAGAVPGTDAVLASAVEGQPDVGDGATLSVPRTALRLLFERAPAREDARRELARLAFAPGARVSDDMRRRASTALAASIRGSRSEEAERLLRLATPPAELAAALEALARDKSFSAPRNE